MKISMLTKKFFVFLSVVTLTAAIGFTSQAHAQPQDYFGVDGDPSGLLSRGLTAELILQEHPDYGDRKVKLGEAEYQDYGDKLDGNPNSQLKIELKRQDLQLKGPFHVYLNEEKIGVMEVVEIEKLGVVYSFHKMHLDTEKGDQVPLILEHDLIQLVNSEFVFVIGKFFDTDDFVE